MIHQETQAPRWWWLCLLLAWLALTLPNLWLPELNYREALPVQLAQASARADGQLLLARLSGQTQMVPPAPTWLLAAMQNWLPLSEFCVRLLGVVPLGLLAALCAWVIGRRAGYVAGAASAAAVLGAVGTLHLAMRGAGEMLFALLINAAWLCWYIWHRERHRPLLAWVLSLLLVALAMLTDGVLAVPLFYGPLLFADRPLTVWRRLWRLDHGLALLLVGSLAGLWLSLVPGLLPELLASLARYTPAPPSVGYLRHYLGFPVLAVLAFFPWCWLAWPAFCAAFRPLEKAPPLAHYLRTIVYTVFLVIWAYPDSQPGALLPLAGPLAMLVGLHYEVLVRRHGQALLVLVRWLAGLALVAGVVGLVLIVFVLARALDWPVAGGILWFTGICLVSAIIMAVFFVGQRQPRAIWLQVLAATVAAHLAVVSAGRQTYEHTWNSPNRQLAATLKHGLPRPPPPGTPIYDMIHPGDIYAVEAYYLGHPLVKVRKADQIPMQHGPVWLLGPAQVPVSRLRQWTSISAPIQHAEHTWQLWLGEPRASRGARPPPRP